MKINFDPAYYDAFLISKVSDLLGFAHNWGITKRMVIPAYAVAMLAIDITLLALAGRAAWSAAVIVGITMLVAFGEMWALKTWSTQRYNLTKLAQLGGVLGTIRIGICVLMITTCWTGSPANLDAPLWAIWLYLLGALIPIEPPKRSLSELLPKFSGKLVPVAR